MPDRRSEIVKTVEIEVPRDVEERARERAGDDGDLGEHLLDALELEFEWVFERQQEDEE